MGTERLFTSRQTGHRFQTAITDFQAAGLEGKAVIRDADRRMTSDDRRRRSGQLPRPTQISLDPTLRRWRAAVQRLLPAVVGP